MTQDLLTGLQEFKLSQYSEENSLMSELAKMGQNPKYFIISCIDSRCNPGTIFTAKPGVFFAHKAMGAIIRPYHKGTALAAALQFAIKHNNIETIIVLGHTQCSAIQALVENINDEEILSFIEVAKHAHDKAKNCCNNHEDIIARTEKEVILESTENLKEYPSVKQALAEKRIDIKTWLFDIATGDVSEHSDITNNFEIITATTTAEDSRQNA